MINMDMIGRIRDGKVLCWRHIVRAGDWSIRWRRSSIASVTDIDKGHLRVPATRLLRAQQIPWLFFFTGLHGDYHRPSDTADRIEHAGITHVVEFAGAVIRELAQRPDRLRPFTHLLPSQ